MTSVSNFSSIVALTCTSYRFHMERAILHVRFRIDDFDLEKPERFQVRAEISPDFVTGRRSFLHVGKGRHKNTLWLLVVAVDANVVAADAAAAVVAAVQPPENIVGF